MRIVLFLLALCCLPACLLAADNKELVGDPKTSGKVTKPNINDAAIDKAGFRMRSIIPTASVVSIVEAVPA